MGISGCYAKDHPYHRDHEESFITIYRNVLKLFDELHSEAPELFIDCTFETAGKLQLQDYVFAEHAEGNWLSNIEEPFPTGALRARQLAWWRTPVMPAGSLVIGTLPIMLGDPRKLSPTQHADLKKWADWMIRMQEKYDYMSYRQDLPGFGEPSEGSWDAWARINTDSKNGGIIGVFRQGALESERQIFVPGFEPKKSYRILSGNEGRLIATLSGSQMANEGFRILLPKKYDSEIFEIESMK